MYISKQTRDPAHGDCYFIARLSRRGPKYIWKLIPVVSKPDVHVDASDVPEAIRERAYDLFERDRLRDDLTAREAQIAQLVARGLTNKKIASDIGTTAGSVRRSLENIFQKLGMSNRTMLAIYMHTAALGDAP